MPRTATLKPGFQMRNSKFKQQRRWWYYIMLIWLQHCSNLVPSNLSPSNLKSLASEDMHKFLTFLPILQTYNSVDNLKESFYFHTILEKNIKVCFKYVKTVKCFHLKPNLLEGHLYGSLSVSWNISVRLNF